MIYYQIITYYEGAGKWGNMVTLVDGLPKNVFKFSNYFTTMEEAVDFGCHLSCTSLDKNVVEHSVMDMRGIFIKKSHLLICINNS